MTLRPLLLALLVGTCVLSAVTAGPAPPGTGHYQGPGVIVAASAGDPPFVDNGAVVCQDTDDDQVPDHGQGGVCIPFTLLAGDSVKVLDASPLIGANVAFQVCVDVSGDGVCTFGGNFSDCERDIIYFSHETSSGANHNPLYVDPALSFATFQECGSQGFPGYVVIVCAGVHAQARAGAGAGHTHEATEGFVQGALTGGTGQGDFCGAPTAFKPYVVL